MRQYIAQITIDRDARAPGDGWRTITAASKKEAAGAMLKYATAEQAAALRAKGEIFVLVAPATVDRHATGVPVACVSYRVTPAECEASA